jgi:hypothetical protein
LTAMTTPRATIARAAITSNPRLGPFQELEPRREGGLLSAA